MAFNRPTLKELVDQYQTDFETRLPELDSRLRRSVLAVMARVQAGVAHLLYGFQSWIALQTLPDTAEAEILERHAAIWGLSRKAAAFATGKVQFTATNGSIIAKGAEIRRSDGANYTVTGDATAVGGVAVATVQAVEAGTESEAAVGVSMRLVSPVSGVTSSGSVSVAVDGGTDAEIDEDLRSRILARIHEPPHGGSSTDYAAWALEVSGVARVWVRPLWLGLGTVGVLFVTDNAENGVLPLVQYLRAGVGVAGQSLGTLDYDGSIIPDAATVARVQAHIDAEDVRPVTADVYVVAPTAAYLNPVITGLAPLTEAVKAEVTAELEDLLQREAEPGGTILVSHIREAVSIAVGEWDHTLVWPTEDVTHEKYEIAVLGEITWSV